MNVASIISVKNIMGRVPTSVSELEGNTYVGYRIVTSVKLSYTQVKDLEKRGFHVNGKPVKWGETPFYRTIITHGGNDWLDKVVSEADGVIAVATLPCTWLPQGNPSCKLTETEMHMTIANAPSLASHRSLPKKRETYAVSVSYTHLTLPTKRIV